MEAPYVTDIQVIPTTKLKKEEDFCNKILMYPIMKVKLPRIRLSNNFKNRLHNPRAATRNKQKTEQFSTI